MDFNHILLFSVLFIMLHKYIFTDSFTQICNVIKNSNSLTHSKSHNCYYHGGATHRIMYPITYPPSLAPSTKYLQPRIGHQRYDPSIEHGFLYNRCSGVCWITNPPTHTYTRTMSRHCLNGNTPTNHPARMMPVVLLARQFSITEPAGCFICNSDALYLFMVTLSISIPSTLFYR